MASALARWIDADRALAVVALLALAAAGGAFLTSPAGSVAPATPGTASAPAPARLSPAGLADPFAPAGASPGRAEVPMPSVAAPATPETTAPVLPVSPASPDAAEPDAARFRLTGVFARGEEWSAVLEDPATGREQSYSVGESVGGAEIVRITAKGVELSAGGRSFALPLKGRTAPVPSGGPARP